MERSWGVLGEGGGAGNLDKEFPLFLKQVLSRILKCYGM